MATKHIVGDLNVTGIIKENNVALPTATDMAGKANIFTVEDVEALTSEMCESLQCGDIVVKSGNSKHAYIVSYKKATEMSLTYCDHENVEEVYYEKTDNTWAKVSKDITPISEMKGDVDTLKTTVAGIKGFDGDIVLTSSSGRPAIPANANLKFGTYRLVDNTTADFKGILIYNYYYQYPSATYGATIIYEGKVIKASGFNPSNVYVISYGTEYSTKSGSTIYKHHITGTVSCNVTYRDGSTKTISSYPDNQVNIDIYSKNNSQYTGHWTGSSSPSTNDEIYPSGNEYSDPYILNTLCFGGINGLMIGFKKSSGNAAKQSGITIAFVINPSTGLIGAVSSLNFGTLTDTITEL